MLCVLPLGVAVAAPAAKTTAKPAPARQAVVVEGDDHLYMASAPTGWVLDDTSGLGSRIRCVFYPRGQKWSAAPTVMYITPLHGFGSKERTLSRMMGDDQRAFLKRNPRGRVVDAGTLATGAGRTAQLRYFSEDGGPPHEAVAYIPERDLVQLVVLSSKTADGFQRALPAWRELIGSYAWVGTKKELGR